MKTPAMVIHVKAFETRGGTKDESWRVRRKTKKGMSLVAIVLGGVEDGQPFDTRQAFDEIARVNGYVKARRRK